MRNGLLRPALTALAAIMVIFTAPASAGQDVNGPILLAAGPSTAKRSAQRPQRATRPTQRSQQGQRDKRRTGDRDAKTRDGDRPEADSRTTETQRTDSGMRRTTTVRDANGEVIGTREGEVERTRTEDGVTTQKTVTGADGRVYRQEGSRSYDPDTGTLSSTTTSTGPDGQTRTRETVGSQTENGRVGTTTVTGPDGEVMGTRDYQTSADREAGTRTTTIQNTGADGQTRTREQTRAYDAETGVGTATTTMTGPDGTTATRDTSVVKTEDGRTTTVIRSDGSVVTQDRSTSYDADTDTRSTDVTWTDESGQTATRSSDATRTEDGLIVTGTGPGGNTGGREITGSYDPETGVWTREVTRLDQGEDAEIEE